MAKTLIAQGSITIMDLSDPYVSSTPPENPFENMLWLDTSVNPPILRIYVYYYDEDGNVIDKAWVVVGEENPIPTGIAFGGYLTCQVTITDSTKGQIGISMGYFSSNKVKKTIISTGFTMQTQLTSNQARKRFIIFTNKDTSFTYNSLTGTNDSFIIAIRQNGKWYYENGNTLVEFEPKDEYCNVGKIVEYSSTDNKNGIKEIVMYAENPESIFNLLTGEGERQGLFTTEDGKVFINGEYINAKNLRVVDTNNKVTFYINEQGEVTINATEFTLKGKDVQDYIDEGLNLDQTTIFNKLTNNGKSQGLYMKDGNFYFNGQYINAKNLKVIDTENNTTLYVDQNGKVYIRATEFTLEGKTIDDYINNIEIGSKNLLRKSSTFGLDSTRKAGWVNSSNQWTVAYSDADQCYVVSTSSSGLTAINIKSFFSNFVPCKIGDTFTLSCWVKVKSVATFDYGVTFIIDEYDDTNTRLAWQDTDPAVTTGTNKVTFKDDEWTYCTATYTVRKDTATKLGIRLSIFKNGEISFKLPKLEKGNKATDWTPAPEDLEDEMDALVKAQKERIDEMLTDGTLTPSEKRQLQRTLEEIEQECTNLITTAKKYSINTDSFYATYNTLKNYLTIDCKINTMEITTGVVKDTLKTCFADYYTEREKIYSAINSAINSNIDGKLSSSDSEAVFNALTNNGKIQGLYLKDGNLYFNGQYVNAKNLKVIDSNNNTTFYVDQDGNVTIRAKDFSLEGKTIDDYIDDVNTDINVERERIDEILDDGTLTTSEKRQLQRMLEDIDEEYANIANIAQSYSINFSDFYSAYNTLSNYLTIDCKINDLTISTGIIKNTLKTCFENYYIERTKLNNSINTTVNNNINGKLSSSDSKAVFDALTESGKKQGLYLKDGNFYFNGQYINAKNLSVQNAKGETTLSIDSDGNVSILATAFKLGGKTITDIITENTVVTMKSVRIWYYISNSPTALSGGSWSTTKPTWVSGQYIWQKTVTTYSNDTTAESDPVCITGPQGTQGNKGDQGVSITKVSNRYGTSTSKTTKPTTWNTSYPSWTKGTYIWTKSIISYSNGTTTETDPYVDTSWEGMSNLVDGKVDNTQTAVFNALTNNGKLEGLYMSNGKLYINGTYIKAETITGDMLKADSIDGKTITGATLKGCRIFAAEDDTQTDGYKFRIYTDGRIFSNNFIQCYGAKPNDNKYSQLDDGFIIATDYVQSPAIKTTKQNLYFGINDVAIPGTGDNTDRLRFCEISGNKFFMPDYNATSSTTGVRLGASGHMWSTVYAKGGVNTGSDRTVKENIRYLNAENELATQSEDINEKDLYNFVKDDLMVAEYNFIGEERTEIGFIAQDILYNLDGSDNKVGQILVNKPDEEQSPLTYSEKTYSNILAGALRQAINKIESLEKRIEELEKK